MGAAMLALAATAPLIGAARSASRSTLTSTLSRSPLSRSPVSSRVGDVVQHLADGAHEVAGGVEDLAGDRVERADHVAGGVHHVARGAVEDPDDVAGGVEDGGAVHEVGHGADHGAHGVEDVAGQGIEDPTTLPEASSTLPVAASRMPRTCAVGPDHARTVHEVGDRSDQVAGRVDHHAGGLVERPEDGAVRGHDVAGGAVQGADDVSGGVHDDAAVDRLARRSGDAVGGSPRRGVAGLGARGEHRLPPASPSAGAVPPTTVSLWSMLLSWMPVATASASTVWVTMTPWSASACELDPSLSRLALTAASIGATTLALRATARSMGAAPSIARSTSAARSRIEMTSLSGRAVTPSLASSSVGQGCRLVCTHDRPSEAATMPRCPLSTDVVLFPLALPCDSRDMPCPQVTERTAPAGRTGAHGPTTAEQGLRPNRNGG